MSSALELRHRSRSLVRNGENVFGFANDFLQQRTSAHHKRGKHAQGCYRRRVSRLSLLLWDCLCDVCLFVPFQALFRLNTSSRGFFHAALQHPMMALVHTATASAARELRPLKLLADDCVSDERDADAGAAATEVLVDEAANEGAGRWKNVPWPAVLPVPRKYVSGFHSLLVEFPQHSQIQKYLDFSRASIRLLLHGHTAPRFSLKVVRRSAMNDADHARAEWVFKQFDAAICHSTTIRLQQPNLATTVVEQDSNCDANALVKSGFSNDVSDDATAGCCWFHHLRVKIDVFNDNFPLWTTFLRSELAQRCTRLLIECQMYYSANILVPNDLLMDWLTLPLSSVGGAERVVWFNSTFLARPYVQSVLFACLMRFTADEGSSPNDTEQHSYALLFPIRHQRAMQIHHQGIESIREFRRENSLTGEALSIEQWPEDRGPGFPVLVVRRHPIIGPLPDLSSTMTTFSTANQHPQPQQAHLPYEEPFWRYRGCFEVVI